ncbi:MAG TPA: winged helix-turn-helix domain-containing protein [Pyrinomonadaceae bacterium]|nr:winged helix-turn-helix domain-containing protein [Pyrinomonadaceae bacterium]
MDRPSKRFFRFDCFQIDVTERQLCRNGVPVRVTPKVFDILLVLVENKGKTIEKKELIRRVWADTFVEEGSLNRNVSTLRKVLGDNSNEQRYIKTLPKKGYRFTGNAEEFTEFEPLRPNDGPQAIVEPAASLVSRQSFKKATAIAAALVILALIAAAVGLLSMRSEDGHADPAGLSDFERETLTSRKPSSPQTLDDYVNGRTLWHRRSADELYQSILLLERAVRNEPDFALAHAALADAYAFDSQRWKEAKPAAAEAMRLDPSLGTPLATIGFVQMYWEWNISEARRSLKKAVEAEPDYPTAHQWLAINLIFGGQGAAAIVEMERARELQPDSVSINADLCQTFYFLQKYDEALAQCRKTLEIDENFLNARLYLHDIYSALEMHDEAVAEFFRAEQLKRDFSLPYSQLERLRKAYAAGGIRAFWQTNIRYYEEIEGTYGAAKYYLKLGERKKAIRALQQKYKERNFDLITEIADPAFRELRNEPEFWELMEEFNP